MNLIKAVNYKVAVAQDLSTEQMSTLLDWVLYPVSKELLIECSACERPLKSLFSNLNPKTSLRSFDKKSTSYLPIGGAACNLSGDRKTWVGLFLKLFLVRLTSSCDSGNYCFFFSYA